MAFIERLRERRKQLLERRPLARVLEKPAAEALPIPILGGAVPARIVKQDFIEPYVGRPELVGILKGLPSFAYGEAYGETAGQWYRVTYQKSIKDAVPVCVARGRSGAITTKVIERVSAVAIPSITIPKVGIRTWHCRHCGVGYFTLVYRSCPECGSSNIEELTAADRYEKAGWYRSLWNAKKRLGDWGILNWARDSIANVFAWLGYYLLGGNGVFVLADALSSQVDKVQSAVQGAFNKAIGDVNDRLKRQTDFVTDRINLRLNDLYAIWGLPENMAVTPVHTRNETDSGFDFQSYGKTTIHFIAIGGG